MSTLLSNVPPVGPTQSKPPLYILSGPSQEPSYSSPSIHPSGSHLAHVRTQGVFFVPIARMVFANISHCMSVLVSKLSVAPYLTEDEFQSPYSGFQDPPRSLPPQLLISSSLPSMVRSFPGTLTPSLFLQPSRHLPVSVLA